MFIEFETGTSSGLATIYNNEGQEIFELQLNENTTQIDTRDLIAGVYIVKITSSNQIIYDQKIIIQK